jgi:DNA-binding response OmpR family regulator
MLHNSTTTTIPASARLPRLAIVDDDAGLRDLLAYHAKALGWVATSHGSAVEVLRLFDDAPADVLLTDLCMPEVDGVQLVTILRTMGWGGVALLMTGCPEEITREECAEIGLACVLGKPFGIELFETLLRGLAGAGRAKVAARRGLRENPESISAINVSSGRGYGYGAASKFATMTRQPTRRAA